MKKVIIAALLFAAVACYAASYNAVSVTSTQTAILPASRDRAGWIIHNVSTSTIYIGNDTAIGTGTALPVLPGEKVVNDGKYAWRGAIKGIGATNTSSEIRFFEWGFSEISQ